VERWGLPRVRSSSACRYLVRRERDQRRRERDLVDDDIWYQAMIGSARSTAQLVQTAR